MHNVGRRLISAVWLLAVNVAAAPLPSGDAVIRATAGTSEIVITTTARLAGAIHSLTWNGKEFIDSADHGRQLQSASNLDAGTPIMAETFNPTEAGSMHDGAGPISTSCLLHLVTTDRMLQTTTQMGFWLRPGEKSGGHPAKNTSVLSDQLLTKRVRIGYRDLPQVLPYEVTFTLPVGESHTHAVFEALTGYLPAEFERFLQFNATSGELEPLDDGPGEIRRPVVLSVASGSHAMGIFAPPQTAPKTIGPTYGRFRFAQEKVVKWNCVFRVTDTAGLTPGEYSFRMFVLVGDLPTITASLLTLHREFSTR
jgi:hypothetical protein